MGVWIEIISLFMGLPPSPWSLPTWECGLKFFDIHLLYIYRAVTPYMGVWIEIDQNLESYMSTTSHSLHGSVD